MHVTPCADEDTGTPYSRRSGTSTDPGDVELMERALGAGEFNSYGVAGEAEPGEGKQLRDDGGGGGQPRAVVQVQAQARYQQQQRVIWLHGVGPPKEQWGQQHNSGTREAPVAGPHPLVFSLFALGGRSWRREANAM